MEKKEEIVISIIILNYRLEKETLECLKSLRASKIKNSFEIIVVNNSKNKGLKRDIKKIFKNVRYVQNSKNVGYGAGNNIGIKKAKGKYLFILNPDTKVYPGAIDRLVAFSERRKGNVAVSPALVDKKENYQEAGTLELTPMRAIFTNSFLYKLLPKNKIAAKYLLKNVDKEKIKEVFAIPGSAFMVRKDVFDKAGKFDEQMFLYFEEHDLGQRLANLGCKLYIYPKAKAMHIWAGEQRKSERINKHFVKSRFYYFKKHFGLPRALCVEAFCRFNKWHLMALMAIITGSFLRFYKIDEVFNFTGEVGDNLLDIKNYYLGGKIPLKGPPTSHPWLDFGPLYFWLYGPILVLSKFDPISHNYFGAFVAVITIWMNYIFISKIWDRKVGLISTFLIAVSPLYVGFTEAARFFTIVLPLVYPFYYFISEINSKKRMYIFYAFLVIGIMLNFHYTPLVLVPLVIFGLIKRKVKLNKEIFKYAIGGLLIPSVPLIINDFVSKSYSLVKFAGWLPYRLLGFLGIVKKNTVSVSSIEQTGNAFYEFISMSFTNKHNQLLSIFVFVGFILILVKFFVDSVKSGKREYKLLSAWFLLSFLMFLVHGNLPLHYFMPVFPIPIIIVSIYAAKLKGIKLKFFLTVLLSISFLSIIQTIEIRDYLAKQINKVESPKYYIQLSQQKNIAQRIASDASGQEYVLRRVGRNDQFEGNFATNYQYLLWYYGNEPARVGDVMVKDGNPEILYTIYETNVEDRLFEGEVIWVGNIAIVKEKIL